MSLPKHRIVAIEADDTSSTAWLYERTSGGLMAHEMDYRAFFSTSLSEVATSDEVQRIAEVSTLPGDGLRYVVRPRAGHTREHVLDAIGELTGTDELRDDPRYDVPAVHEALLFDTGIRMFDGLADADIKSAVVHLLVGRDNPHTDRNNADDGGNVLVAAGVRCGGRELIVAGAERDVASQVVDLLVDEAPDVIVGFDFARRGLALLRAAARRANDDRLEAVRVGRRARIDGLSILDLESLSGFGPHHGRQAWELSELASLCAVPAPVPLSPRELRRADAETLTRQCEAELDVAAHLVGRHLSGAIELTRRLPATLAEVAHSSPASLIDRAMRAEYHGVHALPIRALAEKVRGGGHVETPATGRFAGVVHLDVVAEYATIVAALNLAPRGDVLRIFPAVVRAWLAQRAAAQATATAAEKRGDHDEAQRHTAVARLLKRYLVQAYGSLGWTRGRFFDPHLRALIAARGRQIADAVRGALEQNGYVVLAIETDGFYVRLAEGDIAAATNIAERVANEAVRTTLMRVRASHVAEAALVLPNAKALSDGTRKGGLTVATSRFNTDVREATVTDLLADDLGAASATVRMALGLIDQRRVSDRDVALSLRVADPPTLLVGNLRHAVKMSEHDRALAVALREVPPERWPAAGERVLVVHREAPGGWRIIEDDADTTYDPGWARAELRRALAPVGSLVDLDRLFAGGQTATGAVPSRLLSSASGDPHVLLVAGVKSKGSRTAARVARSTDAATIEAFRAEHGDAHALLLPFFGEPEQPALGFRVRTGDFYIEFEHETDDARPLDAARACLDILEEHGADLDRDVRVLFNGHRSYLVRVRQAALGAENCIELPELYRAFAADLSGRVQQRLGVAAPVHDADLYASTSTYRLAGVAHEATGAYATGVAPQELRASSPAALRKTAGSWQPTAPFGVGPAVLEASFEYVTAGIPRTQSHDASARAIKPESLARKQRREAAHRLRLRVVGSVGAPPCAETILDAAARGDSIGFARLAKAVHELRLIGYERREIAARLAAGLGGPRRYDGRVVHGQDGPDLHPDLWPDDPEHGYYRSCTSTSARSICSFEACYRARDVVTFDDAISPEFAPARRAAFAATDALVVPDAPGIQAHEVPPRSGKTTKLAQLAIDLTNAGDRVLVVAPTHAALDTFMERLARAHRDRPLNVGRAAVHLVGRGKNNESCALAFHGRPHCGGCPNDVTVGGGAAPNPKLATIRRRKRQVIDRAALRDIATNVACMRSTSRKLAREASIVVATHAHLLLENLEELVGTFTAVLVDEADALVDALAASSESLVIATSRQEAAQPLATECKMNCQACHLAFSDGALDAVAWKGTVSVSSAAAQSSPSNLLDVLDHALGIVESQPDLMPAVDLGRLRKNLVALAAALPEPSRLRRGHSVSPRAYGAGIAEAVARSGSAVEIAAAAPYDTTNVRVTVRRCVADEAPHADDAERRWRRELIDDERMRGAGLPPVSQHALKTLASITDFLDHGARTGDAVLLVPEVRPGTWATFRPWCRLVLRTVDRRGANRVAEYLDRRRSLLVSGTLPADAILRGLLPSVVITHHPVPLHRDATVLLHTMRNSGRSEPVVPRALAPDALAELIFSVRADTERLMPWRERMVVRVFCRSRSHRDGVAETWRRTGHAFTRAEDGAAAPGSVVLDYLRSSDSRAVDIPADLIVIYGSGLPRFDDLHALAEVVAHRSAEPMSVDAIADDSRRRAVLQAMLRAAALPGLRAVVVANDMTVADLPRWMQARVKSADALYASIPEDAEVAAEQRRRLGSAIVDALLEPRVPPTLAEVLAWTPSPLIGARDRRQAANRRRLNAVRDAAARGSTLRPSECLAGSAEDWSPFLSWLAWRGLLTRIGDGRSVEYVAEQQALRALDTST